MRYQKLTLLSLISIDKANLSYRLSDRLLHRPICICHVNELIGKITIMFRYIKLYIVTCVINIMNSALRGENLKRIREREYIKNMKKYYSCYNIINNMTD